MHIYKEKLFYFYFFVLMLIVNVCFSEPVNKQNNRLDCVKIDKHLGNVIKTHFTGSDRWVIYIQDYHAHPEAQTKIASIIEDISKQTVIPFQKYYKPNMGPRLLVGIEGHTGSIESSKIRDDKSIPNHIKKMIIDYYLKKGVLNGSEYLDLNKNCFLNIVGLEDNSLYKKDKGLFLNCLADRELGNIDFDSQAKMIFQEMELIGSDTTLKFMDSVNNYLSGRFSKYHDDMEFIVKQCDKFNINISKDKNLSTLYGLIKEGAFLSDNLILRDIEEMTAIDLLKKMSNTYKFKLMKCQADFLAEKINLHDYVIEVIKLAKQSLPKEIEYYSKTYEHVFDAYDYYSKWDNFVFSVGQETTISSPVFEALADKLFSSDEKKLYDKLKMVKTLEKLIALELNRNDWSNIQKQTANIKSFLNKNGMGHLIAVVDEAIEFYRIAELREKPLITNLLNQIDKNSPVKGTVLVTGGFHTEGITRLLEESGIDYSVIVPIVNKVGNTAMYYDVMTGTKTSLEKRIDTFLSQTIASEPGTSIGGPVYNLFNTLHRTNNLKAVVAAIAIFLGAPVTEAASSDGTIIIDDFNGNGEVTLQGKYSAFGENNIGQEASGETVIQTGTPQNVRYLHKTENGSQKYGIGIERSFNYGTIDISGYDALAFQIYSKDDDPYRTIDLNLIFEGNASYSLKYSLEPTLTSSLGNWRKVVIPLTQNSFEAEARGEFNLSKLQKIQFVMRNNGQDDNVDRTVYFDDIEFRSSFNVDDKFLQDLNSNIKPTIVPEQKQTPWEKYANGPKSNIALYITNPNSNWLGLVHGLKAIGVPVTTTIDSAAAVQHDVVIVYPDASLLSVAEQSSLRDFVKKGGTLIGIGVDTQTLNDVYGIDKVINMGSNKFLDQSGKKIDITSIRLNTDGELAREFTHPSEKRISIRRSWIDSNFWWTNFIANKGATPIANYDDNNDDLTDFGVGNVAILYNSYGNGHAYAFGFDMGLYILLGHTGRSEGISKSYINDYVPHIDILLRLIKNIYVKYQYNAVMLHPVPFNHDLAVMLTHDVDASTSYRNSLDFSAIELEYGVSATYFLQVKYLFDHQDVQIFTPEAIASSRQLMERGMEIASHSIAHSPVFDLMPLGTGEEQFQDYDPKNIEVDGKLTTPNGTILGETRISRWMLEHFIPGANINSFRPGHLLFPDQLPQVLNATGYNNVSTLTVGDALGHLPFRHLYNRAFGESVTETNLREFPVTIEDELNGPMINRLDSAIGLAQNISRYGGSLTLLIHPDETGQKLDFLKGFIGGVKDFSWFTTMSQYGKWLDARDNVIVDVSDDNVINLTIHYPIAGLTIEVPKDWVYVSNSANLPDIEFIPEQRRVIIHNEVSGSISLYFTQNAPKLGMSPSSPDQGSNKNIPLGSDPKIQVSPETGRLFNMNPLVGLVNIYEGDKKIVIKANRNDNSLGAIPEGINPVFADEVVSRVVAKEQDIVIPAFNSVKDAVMAYGLFNDEQGLKKEINTALIPVFEDYSPGEASSYLSMLYNIISPLVAALSSVKQAVVFNAVVGAIQPSINNALTAQNAIIKSRAVKKGDSKRVIVISPDVIIDKKNSSVYPDSIIQILNSQLGMLSELGYSVFIPVSKDKEPAVRKIITEVSKNISIKLVDDRFTDLIEFLREDYPDVVVDNVVFIENKENLLSGLLLGFKIDSKAIKDLGLRVISVTPDNTLPNYMIELAVRFFDINTTQDGWDENLRGMLSSFYADANYTEQIPDVEIQAEINRIVASAQKHSYIINPDRPTGKLDRALKDMDALMRFGSQA